MIRYTKGDLLASDAQALVNTVNTVGVMGKGIALQFKERFPENFRAYKQVCERGELKPGKLFIFREAYNFRERIIVNFPTKTDWRRKSSYAYIETGLEALVKWIREEKIKSIAVPPLGCGNGGLNWEKVKAIIEKYLADLEDTEVIIYEPNPQIKAELRKAPSTKTVKLTPARAMLLYALYQYESLGEHSSLLVANKLAYFLQRMGERLRLTFVAAHFGPYSVQVGHVLYALNGVYLHGLEQKDAKAFEPLVLNYDKYEEVARYIQAELSPDQQNRLAELLGFIAGFQSAFSLELLASIDYLLQAEPSLSVEEVQEKIGEWSARKTNMFKPEYVQTAYRHLQQYSQAALS